MRVSKEVNPPGEDPSKGAKTVSVRAKTEEHMEQLHLPHQQGQAVRRAGQPGDLQNLTVKKLAVIFMGWLRSTHGDPLQKHVISGLICHLVHLSVVMSHPMRCPAGIDHL